MSEIQLQLFGPGQVLTPEPVAPEKETEETLDEYEAFVKKFETKKTTDDCYTPQPVFDAVLNFVGTLTDLEGVEIVRPFWPGADFTQARYPDGCVVVDNPPFSILAKIIRYFTAHGIRFFLFAPSLTLFTAQDCDVTYIVADADITYANGAQVRTGFITNLVPDLRIWCCPELMDAINEAQAIEDKTKRGFVYPWNIVTAATLQKITAHGVELKIGKRSSFPIKDCDAAKAAGRSLFGGGYLLSTRAAAERAAAERAAAERAAAERAAAERAAAERAAATELQLSPRELRIIAELDKQAGK